MFVSDSVREHMDEAIDADFTAETGITPPDVPPAALKVARRLEKFFRYADAFCEFGWALGWAILFVPCTMIVGMSFFAGQWGFGFVFSIGSVITGVPLFLLVRKGIRKLRTPIHVAAVPRAIH